MRHAICNEIFKDWKLEDAFSFAAQAGYGFVEIAPFTIAPYVTDISGAGRARIRGAASRAGIGITLAPRATHRRWS